MTETAAVDPAATVTVRSWGSEVYVVPPLVTFAALTVYWPGTRPVRVSVAVNDSLKLAGPVTVTAASVPSGSPAMVTARPPVVASQTTAKVVVAVWPATTVRLRGF